MDQSPKDEYVVRLWIRGKDLDPKLITERIGLAPTVSTRRGDVLRGTKRAPIGSWAFEERPGGSWDTLEEGLLSLAAILLPLKETIAALSSEYEVFLGCAVLKNSFEGGPEFSPALFRTLAELGLQMNLSCFLPSPAEEQVMDSTEAR
jgi:hypothetical protein